MRSIYACYQMYVCLLSNVRMLTIKCTYACRYLIISMTLTDFTLHFSLTFTKLLYCKFIPLLNNFTMQEKCY